MKASSTMLLLVFAASLGWRCCSSDNSTEVVLPRPRLSGPSEALVNRIIVLECSLSGYPRDQDILLQVFKKGNRSKVLAEYSLLGKETGSFHTVIKPYHDGNLECVAKGQSNPHIEPTVSNTHQLKVIEPVEVAEVSVVSGAVEFWEGAQLELLCRLSAGTHVSYSWLLNGRPVSGALHGRQRLLISRTSPEDSGFYTCVATNIFNQTEVFSSNSSVLVIVKEVVSNPAISLEVIKESSQNYLAAVTCQSDKGAPPVTFSLYNGTELVTNTTSKDRKATFLFPLVLGAHMGWLQCRANNGNRPASSARIPVQFVPVGGPVSISSDYDVGENFAVIGLRLSCRAAAGSHPRYRWFLNQVPLQDRGSFYYVVNQPPEESVLLLSVGSRSAGTYRCEVADRFDNSSAVSSPRLSVSKEGVNRLPVLVVAVVFGSFALLLVMAFACCLTGILFRRKQDGIKPLRTELEMNRMVPEQEDELDLSAFSEDCRVVNAARDAELPQPLENSSDVDEE